jgi:hypothetical protein
VQHHGKAAIGLYGAEQTGNFKMGGKTGFHNAGGQSPD